MCTNVNTCAHIHHMLSIASHKLQPNASDLLACALPLYILWLGNSCGSAKYTTNVTFSCPTARERGGISHFFLNCDLICREMDANQHVKHLSSSKSILDLHINKTYHPHPSVCAWKCEGEMNTFVITMIILVTTHLYWFSLSIISQGIYNGCCLWAHISPLGIITPGSGQAEIWSIVS